MARRIAIAAALSLLGTCGPARAWVREGQPAPAFTKNTLAGGPPWSAGAQVSLDTYAGKVIVLFLLGCT